MPIEHRDPRRDGALDDAGMRRKLESRGYRCTVHVYPPGNRFLDHVYDVDKIDPVLSGQFPITLEGVVHDLKSGNFLQVPRGRIHQAVEIGAVPVTGIDAVKSPS
jgi:mannose-6-phosphate isomerase-like protein (cupin superfamily)